MRNFINFIIKTLILLVVLLGFLLFFVIFYSYLFSPNKDKSLKSAISYVQTIGTEIINSTHTEKTSIELSSNENNLTSNMSVVSSRNNYKYYYNQLDDNGKIIYTALENNMDNLKKENYIIDFSTQFDNLLHKSNGQRQLNKAFQSALDALIYDYPQLFYINISKLSLNIKYVSIGPITTYTVTILPTNTKDYLHDGFTSEQEVDIAISKVENIKNNLINSISNYDDYTKILKVHDTLINSLKYDSEQTENHSHNVYGALVKKNVVCEGYAKAFKYILDSLNIENILVSGTATNTSGKIESHMWNYVKINKNWYGVDVTWDDPIIIGGSSKNNIRHTYFLKGSRTFLESHVPSGKISDTGMLFSLPTLSKNNYK